MSIEDLENMSALDLCESCLQDQDESVFWYKTGLLAAKVHDIDAGLCMKLWDAGHAHQANIEDGRAVVREVQSFLVEWCP